MNKLSMSKQLIEDQIKDVKYFNDGTLTICVITTIADFKVIGTSNVVDPAQYDSIKGMQIAYDKAFTALGDNVAFYVKIVNHQ